MFKYIVKITSIRFKLPIRNISIHSPIFQSSSIDTEEYQKFQSFAEEWWNKEGFAKLLHNYNTVRVPFIVNNLRGRGILDPKYVNTSTPLKNISIAEVGCGGGILTEALAELGANISGIDINKDLINIAKNHARQNQHEINYILAEVESLSETHKNKYDVIVNSECIEHIADGYQESFLKANIKLARLLAGQLWIIEPILQMIGILPKNGNKPDLILPFETWPGGSIFITTMNKTFKCWFWGIFVGENLFHALPKGTHEWRKFLTPAQINNMLEKYNCVPQVVHGFHTSFLKRTWKFNGRNDKMFYGIHAIKKSDVQ